jgi:topoisomerase-4 subunit A
VPVAALPNARGDGVPVTTLVDLSGGTQGKGVRIQHYYAGPADKQLLLASSAGFGFIAKAGDMISRLKGGKSFITLDEGDLPLPPSVVADDASAIAALSENGRLLVFGMSEMKTLTNGGRGVTLMELEPKEKLLSAAAITQKGVIVHGTMAAKPRALEMSGNVLAPHFGKRARKGKTLVQRIKPSSIAPM